MEIECRDGKKEVDPTWIKAWNEERIGVNEKLIDLQGYCRDDGKKKPKMRGLRNFLGSIIRKDCPMRQEVKQACLVQEPPRVSRATEQNYLQQMKATVGL